MKIFRIIPVFISLTLVLSGCSQSSMLNDMTVVQGAALDEIEGRVCISIQYLDLNKGSGKNEGLNSSLTANAYGFGDTLVEAVKNLAKTLPDRLFFGQAKLIVIGDEFYKTRMNELDNELLRNNNVRCDMLLSRSTLAYRVLQSSVRNERVPVDGLCKELKTEGKLVRVNDYLANRKIRLPEIVTNKEYGYVR